MPRIILAVLAALLVGQALWNLLTTTHYTLGSAVLWLLCAALAAGAVFYGPLAAFAHTVAGRWVLGLLAAGVAAYAGIAVFLCAAADLAPATGSEQALIVLGAGLNGDRVNGVLRRRLDAACDFALAHPQMPVVVSGGQGPGETRTEAAAMKEYLVAHGLPKERILMENRSASTQENFRFSMQLLRENGFGDVQQVAFVTNRFHCYRAGLIAGRLGLQAGAVPATISASAALPCYLREVLAVLYYWLVRRA